MSMLLYSNIFIHADTRSRREPTEHKHFFKSNAVSFASCLARGGMTACNPRHHRMVSAFVACTASGIGGSNARPVCLHTFSRFDLVVKVLSKFCQSSISAIWPRCPRIVARLWTKEWLPRLSTSLSGRQCMWCAVPHIMAPPCRSISQSHFNWNRV